MPSKPCSAELCKLPRAPPAPAPVTHSAALRIRRRREAIRRERARTVWYPMGPAAVRGGTVSRPTEVSILRIALFLSTLRARSTPSTHLPREELVDLVDALEPYRRSEAHSLLQSAHARVGHPARMSRACLEQ